VNRRRFLAATGGLAGLAGCTSALGLGDEPCRGEDCHIGMTRNEFVPDTYEITAGDTVGWRNTSSADHTVTAYDDGIPGSATYFATGGYETEAAAREEWFDSRGGNLGPRETFEQTFGVAGTYAYVCLPHERAGMTGKIVVSE